MSEQFWDIADEVGSSRFESYRGKFSGCMWKGKSGWVVDRIEVETPILPDVNRVHVVWTCDGDEYRERFTITGDLTIRWRNSEEE